jgi:hypothetical protein
VVKKKTHCIKKWTGKTKDEEDSARSTERECIRGKRNRKQSKCWIKEEKTKQETKQNDMAEKRTKQKKMRSVKCPKVKQIEKRRNKCMVFKEKRHLVPKWHRKCLEKDGHLENVLMTTKVF